MVNLGVGKGSIQGGIRPVVIISNSMNNKFSPTVNVLPVTSRAKKQYSSSCKYRSWMWIIKTFNNLDWTNFNSR